MRVYLMRMVECGIPRRTAIKVYRDFKARDKLPALKVWPLIDEMMATLQVLQPRLYNAVMQRL